jgi:hypothetical protein
MSFLTRYDIFAFVLAGIVLLVPAPFCGPQRTTSVWAQGLKQELRATASLTITHDGSRQYTEPLALVTLYREGQPVRSAELEQRSMTRQKVTWQKLPVGAYEIHFEAAGFKKFIKRIILAEDAPEIVLQVQLGLNQSYELGAGPSSKELQEEIAQLKKTQADLGAQVQQLQAEVRQLKK